MNTEDAKAPAKADIIRLGQVIDHLVDSMGDPSVSVRRALILLDIDANPHTTQNAIGERLNLEKSVVSRNVDWLWSHGCVVREAGRTDARESQLQTSQFTHKHLQLALRPFGNQHELLKKSLEVFIALFHKHMPSLRELKALITVGAKGQASRSDVINNLYDGPPTTDQRAIKTLIEEGIVKSHEQ
ncbi:MAG: MarR family winged helix-turn-helix transcriptional regulator [Alphaproteobacteria bacterium]|nr:MarR family winged helix-turn-helix transcriptional regulator [Alphaproteobacteria bacterium]